MAVFDRSPAGRMDASDAACDAVDTDAVDGARAADGAGARASEGKTRHLVVEHRRLGRVVEDLHGRLGHVAREREAEV